MAFAYFLKRKSQVEHDRVRDFVEFIERQTGEEVKLLCYENGGEYGSTS